MGMLSPTHYTTCRKVGHNIPVVGLGSVAKFDLPAGCPTLYKSYGVFTPEQDNDKTNVEPVHSYDAQASCTGSTFVLLSCRCLGLV